MWDLSQCLSTAQVKGGSPALHDCGPSSPPSMLLPRFLLFSVPEDPQGSCTRGSCPCFICPRASCFCFAQLLFLLAWVLPNGTSVLRKAGRGAECIWQALPSPWESCTGSPVSSSLVQQMPTGWHKNPSMVVDPSAMLNWSLMSQPLLITSCQCITLSVVHLQPKSNVREP